MISEYCPICQREIEAEESEGIYIFIHDDIIHADEDLEALEYGIQ